MSDHPAVQAALKTSDAAFALVALGTLAKILPALAALLSCIWYLIRIGEWVAKKARRRQAEPGSDD
jgi:hypothetical protein